MSIQLHLNQDETLKYLLMIKKLTILLRENFLIILKQGPCRLKKIITIY